MSLLCLLLIAVLFQNCDYSSEGPSLNASTRDQVNADAMPFAFDIDIDHIAYMSCRGENFHLSSGHPFFSFRAGGYQSGSGVGFQDNFLDQYGGFTETRLKDLLSISNRNRTTGVVMSVRETGQFQNVLRFSADDETQNLNGPGQSFAGLMFLPGLQTLTDSRVLDVLLDQRTSPVNYLRGVSGLQDTRAFDGSINLFSNNDPRPDNTIPTPPANGADKAYRDALQDQAYLAFTFATEDLERPGLRARSPFTVTGETNEGRRAVFGKGYQFNFSEYDNYVGTGFRSSSQKRAVAQVRAFNLDGEASINETWSCPDDQKYIIVRQQDALRRYDGIAISPANHPFREYDRVDPTDTDSGLDNSTDYVDGAGGPGGYYYTFEKDYDGNGELDFVRHKVICPLVADQIPADIPANQAEREAWERVRRILPTEDWYVFRGPKYNCVVPKNDTGNICYAGGLNFNEGLDERQSRNLVQYFADEDHPDIRIDQERRDQADVDIDIEEISITPDCGPTSGTSHGGRNYCPHVVSVCYRLN